MFVCNTTGFFVHFRKTQGAKLGLFFKTKKKLKTQGSGGFIAPYILLKTRKSEEIQAVSEVFFT